MFFKEIICIFLGIHYIIFLHTHTYILSWKSESESCSVVSDSLWPHGLYCPWNYPGQNTGVGIRCLLQRIFLTQGLDPGFPGLPHCMQIPYQLSHQGNRRILEWIAYPFSSRSSQPRNPTGVSCIAGRFFTSWATREAMYYMNWSKDVWIHCMCVCVCVCVSH